MLASVVELLIVRSDTYSSIYGDQKRGSGRWTRNAEASERNRREFAVTSRSRYRT
jgi:hypothetical protein